MVLEKTEDRVGGTNKAKGIVCGEITGKVRNSERMDKSFPRICEFVMSAGTLTLASHIAFYWVGCF